MHCSFNLEIKNEECGQCFSAGEFTSNPTVREAECQLLMDIAVRFQSITRIRLDCVEDTFYHVFYHCRYINTTDLIMTWELSITV